VKAWRGIAARMEGRAKLCGEVRAITVEAGEDVGAIHFGLMVMKRKSCARPEHYRPDCHYVVQRTGLLWSLTRAAASSATSAVTCRH
jgi:hypothetical protein